MNWALSVALPGACSPSPGAFVSYGGFRFRGSPCIVFGFRGSRTGSTQSRRRGEEDEEDPETPVPRVTLKKMRQRHFAEDDEEFERKTPVSRAKQRYPAKDDEEFERERPVSRVKNMQERYYAEDDEESEDWDDSEDEEEREPEYDPELQHKFMRHGVNRKLNSLRRRLLARSQAAKDVEEHAKSESEMREIVKKPKPKKVREEPVISLEDHVRKLFAKTGEEPDSTFSQVFNPKSKTPVQAGFDSSIEDGEEEQYYESDAEDMIQERLSKHGRKGRYDDEDAEASFEERVDISREASEHGRNEEYGDSMIKGRVSKHGRKGGYDEEGNDAGAIIEEREGWSDEDAEASSDVKIHIYNGSDADAMIQERVNKRGRKGWHDDNAESSSDERLSNSREASKHRRKEQYGKDAEAMSEERVNFSRESTKQRRKGQYDEGAERRFEEKVDFSRQAGKHGKERRYGEDVKKTRKSQKAKDEEVRLEDAFYSRKSFRKIGASDEIIGALLSMQIHRPSEIQAIAYKNVYRGNDCIIADQTGSGKTLAYLAPLVQYLREEELKGESSAPRNPRVIILVPTTELASQVLNVCRAMSKVCPFKSMVATGGFKWKTQVDSLESGPDVVVATPGRFLQHLEEGTIELNKLLSVVLDEVDILFEEEDFTRAVSKIRNRAPANVQYIHVTATLPTDVFDKIIHNHPLSIPCMGPGLHITTAGLSEILVDCSGGQDDEKTPESAFANKKGELLKLLKQPAPKTIIFCNKIESCRKVENILNRYDKDGSDFEVLPYHSALSQDTRLENLKEFQKKDLEVSKFLVCTDRASRGLDATGVERVILFDFPREPSEYIRRVGRTARAGGSGKVFVFVVGKQVPLAKKVMSSNEKRQPVHTVPGANYL